MNTYHDISLRSARDRVISILFGGLPSDPAERTKGFGSVRQAIPYPLLDLPVAYRTKAPFESRPVIFVLGGQEDIQYMLCDEAGIPVSYSEEALVGEPVELTNPNGPRLEEALLLLPGLTIHPEEAAATIDLATPEQREAFQTTWQRLIRFDAPPITGDVTYTILAARYVDTLPEVGIPGLWAYLHEPVTFRVGIDTVMPTCFIDLQATDKLGEDGHTITIDFNQPARDNRPLCIEILDSQEEVHYQVLELLSDGTRVERSEIVVGGTQGSAGDMRLVLDLNGSFEEDTTLVIRAFREEGQRDVDDPLVSADLEGLLKVLVRPNPAVTFNLLNAPLPYGASPEISLAASQASVQYELFVLPLRLSYTYERPTAAYLPDGSIRVSALQPFFEIFKTRLLDPSATAWISDPAGPPASQFTTFLNAFFQAFRAKLRERGLLGPNGPMSILDADGDIRGIDMMAFFIAFREKILSKTDPYEIVEPEGVIQAAAFDEFFERFKYWHDHPAGPDASYVVHLDKTAEINTFNEFFSLFREKLLPEKENNDLLGPEPGRKLLEPSFNALFTASKEALLGEEEPGSLLKAMLDDAGNLADSSAIRLQEDHLLLVKATKKDNGEWLFLDQYQVAFVEPDPAGPELRVEEAGDYLRIFVRNPQRRVGYQLRDRSGNEVGPTMLPGADRGVGWEAHGRRFGMRLRDTPASPPADPGLSAIFGDLTVAAPGQSKTDLFPGDALAFVPFVPDKRKVYEVLLIKEYSGVEAVLKQKLQFQSGAWQVVD